MASTRQKRPARATAEVQELILHAARRRFAAQGYAGATTREIAAAADVSEYLLFKYFGSKKALFETAVIEPFRAAVDEFLNRWGTQSGPHPPEFTAHEFIDSLYGLVEDQRELLMALMGSDPDASPMADQPLIPLLAELERVGGYELGALGYQGVDLQVVIRCMFAMVVFNGAFGNSLYPRGTRRPDRDRVITEMTALFVHGVAHRPVDG